MKILHTHKELITRLFILERSGRYGEALAELGDIWADKSSLPNLEGLEPAEAAAILLRCGSLFGFLGHTRHLANSQEISKDLLMNARNRFQDIYDVEKIAECETYLALAYWRTGEYNEAETWIGESLSHDLPNSNKTRLFSNIIKCLLDLPSKRYEQMQENLSSLERYFLECDDDYLKGDYYNYVGLADKNIGSQEKALRSFEMARHYHARAGHVIYQATASNNIALIYKNLGQFQLSHEAIDRAIVLFRASRDKTREGFSYDSKAHIYLDEHRYAEALAASEKAIEILKGGENSGYLAEAYLTRAIVELAKEDGLSPAIFSLLEAVNIARTTTDKKKAEILIEEFEQALEKRNFRGPSVLPDVVTAKDNMKLTLPPELAHYKEYQGIWINNSHLESAGLRKGVLAVIVRGGIERGELVAVADNKTGEISCGVYDREFGLVSLDGEGGEPTLFDEKQVSVLGKIIGFCDPAKQRGGKMTVEPITAKKT